MKAQTKVGDVVRLADFEHDYEVLDRRPAPRGKHKGRSEIQVRSDGTGWVFWVFEDLVVRRVPGGR